MKSETLDPLIRFADCPIDPTPFPRHLLKENAPPSFEDEA